MKWHWLPDAFLLFLVLGIEGGTLFGTQASTTSPPTWSTSRKLAARERTRELWYHGFDNYMLHAFPMDELMPLSCEGQGPDWSRPHNIARNDVAGNFSLTLLDVLDTFVVLNDSPGFEKAVRDVINTVSFSSNVKPQLFETTIRALGGLLSGHQFASNSDSSFYIPWYQGELLDLALDLGSRLLPAFQTPTGIPYARVNLLHGVMKGETTETCTAGAGSLMLEFATLSRLSGNDKFEKVARKAFFAIWNRRSSISLVGNTIDVVKGEWNFPEITGIGAGIDSFYEYALKWYILSGETEFLDVWDDAYAAIMRYARAADGFWYRPVFTKTGDAAYTTIDSLAAFWPGLQVLAGDVEAAVKLHLLYYNLWRKHSGLPEVYDTSARIATSHQYPLRPEFVESTWYLYRATKDPFYLDVADRILFDVTTRAKVHCGLAGISDLRTNSLDDRMESFALSETLKYLYLIFDEDNPLHRDDSNYVLTTEGHILTLKDAPKAPPSHKRAYSHHECPAYNPFSSIQFQPPGLLMGPSIRLRDDYDYTRELVGQTPSDSDQASWSPYGMCSHPSLDVYAFDVVLSSNGKSVHEDLSPSLFKIAPVDDGYIVNNVTGIRTHIVRRLDGKGYDIRKMGHYTVRPGSVVYINDTTLFAPSDSMSRDAEVALNFFVEQGGPGLDPTPFQREFPLEDLQQTSQAFTSMFGTDLSATAPATTAFSRQDPLMLYWENSNLLGCQPFAGSSHIPGVVVVYRGDCSFLQKLLHAKEAGAQGVLVISDRDELISPSASKEELAVSGDLSDVFLLVLSATEGEKLKSLLDRRSAQSGLTQVFVGLVRDIPSERPEGGEGHKSIRIRHLYLNGIPLLNTRLLV